MSSTPIFCLDQLRRDAGDPNSNHDFGKDIIPYIVKNGRAVAHQFSRSCVRAGNDQPSYWRDVGTVDAYWSANIDLTDVVPELDLYDRVVADLDLRGDHAAREIRPRRGRPPRRGGDLAGLGRMHRIRRLLAPLAALHRRASAFACQGGERRDPALCRCRPACAPEAMS